MDTDGEITLALLNVVESDSKVTQRSVANELGIALGLTNSYLKRCIKKGLIKVSQAPANRYAYYLTPHGFAEKSRLTAEYLSTSFNFFRRAREECSELFDTCEARHWRSVVFLGKSDLVEIATLCADNYAIELVGIVDTNAEEITFMDIPVFKNIGDVDRFDAAIISDLRNPQRTFDEAVVVIQEGRVLAPRFANISRVAPQFAE